MKNIIIINGSPRKSGNNEMLCDAFIIGATKAGNQIEKINVNDYKINGCIGCDYCKTVKKDVCFQNDDMNIIYEKLSLADVIVFASPVYFYSVSSQLKCLIDRLHNPVRSTFKVKKTALLLVGADTISTLFDSIENMYNSILKYFSLENGGIIKAFGCREKNDVTKTDYINQAYELGSKI